MTALGRSVLLVLLACAAPCAAVEASFSANELRGASMKDRLHGIETTLKDGSEGARRHSLSVTEAFRGTDDWAAATETYYSRKGELLARAAKLEKALEAVVARNSPEDAESVEKALDEIYKKGDVLRSDYELYLKLPALAAGPQRPAAQAAMRLLGQTGDYRVSLAYLVNRTPTRPPFAALPPAVISTLPR